MNKRHIKCIFYSLALMYCLQASLVVLYCAMYEKGDSPWGFFGLSVFGALICFFVSILGAAALMIYKQFKLAMVCLLLGLIYWPFTIVVVKIAFVVFGIPHDGNAIVKPYNKKRQSVKVFRLSERYMPTIVRT